MPRMPGLPMGQRAVAHPAWLACPAHEQRHPDPRPQAQNLDRALVPYAQTVLQTEAVQPLMPAALHAPIVAIHVQKRGGTQWAGGAAGDQVFHFLLGLRATLPVQAADLRRSGQAQLQRFNRARRQWAASGDVNPPAFFRAARIGSLACGSPILAKARMD